MGGGRHVNVGGLFQEARRSPMGGRQKQWYYGDQGCFHRVANPHWYLDESYNVRGVNLGGFIARGAMKPHRRQAKTSVVWGKSGRKVRFRGLPAIGIRSGNSGFLRAAYYRGIRRTRRPGTREKEIGFERDRDNRVSKNATRTRCVLVA